MEKEKNIINHTHMKNIFSNNLKRIRTDLNFTQEDVANSAHIARSTYIAYEQGHTIPDAITLKLIAEKFNVSIDEILGHQIDENKKVEKEKKRKAWWESYED